MAGAGVLFDVDGTLVDTTYIHAVCWGQALRDSGHIVPMSAVHHAIGMGGDELLAHLLGSDREAGGDQKMSDRHLELYQQYWGRLSPLPGAAELLRACAGDGLQVVLASSATEPELAKLRAALGADDAISATTASDDAGAGKPDPDIVHTALSEAGLDRAVFVGDAVWDAAAAGRAGIPFVGVTCGGTSEVDLYEAGAVEVWRDPAHLLVHLDVSVIGGLLDPA
jgi:HAD superfamily hydrolase (TIGR01549 family)